MTGRLFPILLIIALTGCFPEAENDLGKDEDNTPDDGGSSLGGTASLVLTTADLDGSDYPLAVKAQIIASAGAQYEIKLNDQVVETGDMPAEPKPQGPFSGITDGNNERWVFFVIPEAGSHTVTLTETLDNEIETDTANIVLGTACEENADFFENESAFGLSDLSCAGSCHSNSGTAFIIDSTSFSTLKTSEIFTRSNYINFAHMPAELDVTPYATGGKLVHSGGVKWTTASATHFRAMETAYRIAEDFVCP
jgi:hypothetical protein